ncbi:MAG: hypothetical protein EXS55_04980 [Candidatus Magasanikbacteria bacterium]|nr:hypothetical protein [Candidatus Magasanikbacteria bacterium]
MKDLTLQQVYDVINIDEEHIALFGIKEPYLIGRRQRSKTIGAAIAHEHSVMDPTKLPKETLLGAESARLFRELCVWILTQNPTDAMRELLASIE